MLFGPILQFTLEKVSRMYAELACMHFNISFLGNFYFFCSTRVFCCLTLVAGWFCVIRMVKVNAFVFQVFLLRKSKMSTLLTNGLP